MSLFLDKDSYEIIVNKQNDMIPIQRLTNNGYIGYYQMGILCECELSKLYNFFKVNTQNSRKQIKRLRLNDEISADMLKDRILTKLNKQFIHKNNRQYKFNRIMPTMEIIEWPENTFFSKTFNRLTRDKYLEKGNYIYGTFVIPLIRTCCSTLFSSVGSDNLVDIAVCDCASKCIHVKSKRCACEKVCKCNEPIPLHISEPANFFYTSDLEPIDIVGPIRINLYVHIEYKVK